MSWMSSFHEDIKVVKEKFYYHIFSTEYNIGFRPTKKDACKDCELVRVNILNLKREKKDFKALEAHLEKHLKKVKASSDLMKEAHKLGDDWATFAMDLQQTLPIPKMSVGQAYYMRKLLLYNFCIHNLK